MSGRDGKEVEKDYRVFAVHFTGRITRDTRYARTVIPTSDEGLSTKLQVASKSALRIRNVDLLIVSQRILFSSACLEKEQV